MAGSNLAVSSEVRVTILSGESWIALTLITLSIRQRAQSRALMKDGGRRKFDKANGATHDAAGDAKDAVRKTGVNATSATFWRNVARFCGISLFAADKTMGVEKNINVELGCFSRFLQGRKDSYR
jgi:hypothetical protein